MASIKETLPFELIDAIIENLAAPIINLKNINCDDDVNYRPALNDLKACSLACRHFVPLCQKYIFHTIVLETHDRVDGPSPQSRIAWFSEIVEASAILGSYVQRLDLWIRPNLIHKFEVDYHPDVVASALQSLTNLKAIFLLPRNVVNWADIPSSFTSEVYRLFHLPTTTTIEVWMAENFNIHSLAPCNALETLILQDSSLSTADPLEFPWITLPVKPKPIRLMNLQILGDRKVTGLLPKITSSKHSETKHIFDFERLEMFSMAITYMDDVHKTSDFLRQVKLPCLKTINLRFAAQIAGDGIATLSLINRVMTAIETLEFWFICPSSGSNEHLLGMCKFLENLSNNNQIQALKITMEYLYLSGTSPSLDDPRWDVINTILQGPGWSSLSQVKLDLISYSNQENLPHARTRAAMLKKLPKTRLRGLSSNTSFKFLFSLKSIVEDTRGFEYTADL